MELALRLHIDFKTPGIGHFQCWDNCILKCIRHHSAFQRSAVPNCLDSTFNIRLDSRENLISIPSNSNSGSPAFQFLIWFNLSYVRSLVGHSETLLAASSPVFATKAGPFVLHRSLTLGFGGCWRFITGRDQMGVSTNGGTRVPPNHPL